MDRSLKIGCVLLAAGSGSRFGSNKLSALFHGKTLFHCALEKIPSDQLEEVVVIIQHAEFSSAIQDFHFTEIANSTPDQGQSHSLHLGVSHLKYCDGILFLVADQPLLRRESVAALIDLWRTQPDKIAALAHNGKRGNPCLFPARFYHELLNVTGDRGGSAVIHAHPDELLLLEAPQEELTDVDTLQALSRLERL